MKVIGRKVNRYLVVCAVSANLKRTKLGYVNINRAVLEKKDRAISFSKKRTELRVFSLALALLVSATTVLAAKDGKSSFLTIYRGYIPIINCNFVF